MYLFTQLTGFFCIISVYTYMDCCLTVLYTPFLTILIFFLNCLSDKNDLRLVWGVGRVTNSLILSSFGRSYIN